MECGAFLQMDQATLAHQILLWNAIYLQIWIAVCTYLLLALTKKKMHMNQSLHTISKNVGLFLTDKTPINELFNKTVPEKESTDYYMPSLFGPEDF